MTLNGPHENQSGAWPLVQASGDVGRWAAFPPSGERRKEGQMAYAYCTTMNELHLPDHAAEVAMVAWCDYETDADALMQLACESLPADHDTGQLGGDALDQAPRVRCSTSSARLRRPRASGRNCRRRASSSGHVTTAEEPF
ncbi:hypothetical protein GCM10022226_61700 [Sphaerisporangium flaviroseum]|uniref:Uncharacterized protein n=1 Tax=Sphaerisporangium flaviroseum TaxID=509199 RepID=A0ABP7J2K3_9ACTN